MRRPEARHHGRIRIVHRGVIFMLMLGDEYPFRHDRYDSNAISSDAFPVSFANARGNAFFHKPDI